MFVRSTTAGADAHCVNADVEGHTRHADRTVRWNWRGTGRGASVLWLALDGGRPLVVANTDKGGMAE